MIELGLAEEARVKSLWKSCFVCGIPQMPTVKHPAEKLLPFTQESHHPPLFILDPAPYIAHTGLWVSNR